MEKMIRNFNLNPVCVWTELFEKPGLCLENANKKFLEE